jgi:predicted  nucleic acid-binding Zn-ribbon protein
MTEEIKQETFYCVECKQAVPVENRSKKVKSNCKECFNRKVREKKREKKINQDRPLVQEVPKIPENQNSENVQVEKKKVPSKNKTSIADLKETTSGLIESLFAIISIRLGEHWILEEEEAQQLANPLINMLNKYGVFKKATKNMDAVVLAVALGSVVGSRAITSLQLSKLKKAVDKGGYNEINEIRDKKREATQSPTDNPGTGNGGNQQRDSHTTSKDINSPYTF